MLKIDPSRFAGKHLFVQHIRLDDKIQQDEYVAVCDGLTVGRIVKSRKADGRRLWDWKVTGPSYPTQISLVPGSCRTREQAKAALHRKLQLWVAWVKNRPGDALWNG